MPIINEATSAVSKRLEINSPKQRKEDKRKRQNNSELTVAVRSLNLFRRSSSEFRTAWSWFWPESFVRRRSRGTECPRFEPAIVVKLSKWTGRSTSTTMNESRISARIGEKRYLRGMSIFVTVLIAETTEIGAFGWWDSLYEKVKENEQWVQRVKMKWCGLGE